MRLIDINHCIETTDITFPITLPSDMVDYIKDVEYIPDVYAGAVLMAILDGINGINGS